MADGFIRNLVVSMELPDPSVNVLNVQVLYDLEITAGGINAFGFGIFNEAFGTVIDDEVVSELVTFEDLGPFITPPEFEFDRNNNGVIEIEVDFRFDEDNAGGLFQLTFDFRVEGAICQNEEQQAIPATWANLIETGAVIRFLEVDYIIPNELVELAEITPEPETLTVGNTSDVATNFFAFYIPDEVGLSQDQVEDEFENLFLNLGQNLFPANETNECLIFEPAQVDFLILVVVILVFCFCILGAACYQNYVDERYARNAATRIRNRLNIFPGSPDIVLGPGQAGEGTTVRALREDEDVQEFDTMVPTTTINVRLSGSVEDGTERDIGTPLEERPEIPESPRASPSLVSL